MGGKETMLIDQNEIYNEFHDKEWIPAPCQMACPVGTDVPSYITLIWEEKFEEAIEVITEPNPFASVCGQVCAMPCESACRRREIGDKPVTIRALKRFVMEKIGPDYHLPPVDVTKKQTIGIVGGGPAGLTAAQDLARSGYAVYVYEKQDCLGGMMNVIPEWRLTRQDVEIDINRILKHCPGIKVHLGCGLGEDISLEELKKKHDAVLLTIGLWKDRKLGIPGEDYGMDNLYGIDFLNDISKGKQIQLEGKAVIIGGGNVSMDVARTALRVGAQKAEAYCLERREEMPAFQYEIEQAEQEEVVIHPSWGPKEILCENGRVTGVEFMRCVSVFDNEGHFNPEYDPDDTMMVEADAVLVSIGLQAENSELTELGLLERGLLKSDRQTMRTQDPKVFAAGDGAFGPSAVVNAMSYGHQAAYYINAFLQGVENPTAYQTPWRTRQLPIPQDPAWETLPREEQPFHGIDKACSFPRLSPCESAIDKQTAKRQAARCFRCDAQTGTANYQRRDREHIRVMADTEIGDAEKYREIFLKRLRPRDNPFPEGHYARLDDLHFLPAGLTRLVIDPYRETCATKTLIGRQWLEGKAKMEMENAYFFSGFDEAPEEVQMALSQCLALDGCGYIGTKPIKVELSDKKVPWLQLLIDGGGKAQDEADGLIYVIGNEFKPGALSRLHEKQLLGLAVTRSVLEKAVPYALDQGFDLLLLDACGGIEKPWIELQSIPDLAIMRDTIRILRDYNMEEEMSLLYFGGLRSGTDAAKVLAYNCNAGVFSVAAAIAIGGDIVDEKIVFNSDLTLDDRKDEIRNWVKGTIQETAIIPRGAAKSNIHNLEPEDLRSITIATGKALDIPLAAGQERREWY
ncbi:MAG: FAD-dependent oxidoreductase [Deltaproteobacteria bacterium]|nr:FAD-dependent oxidoreductase [Deltaproteobacteria bacterium]